MPKASVAPGASELLWLEFAPRPNATRPVENTYAHIEVEGDVLVTFGFKHFYKSFVAFPKEEFVEHYIQPVNPLNGSKTTIRIPIVHSADVNLTDIQIQSSADLKGIEWKVEEIEDNWFLTSTLPRVAPLSGTLGICVKDQRDFAECRLQILPKPRVEVSPKTARFRKTGISDETDRLEFTCMLKSVSPLKNGGISAQFKDPPNSNINIESIESLAPTVHRVTLSVAKGEPLPAEFTIELTARLIDNTEITVAIPGKLLSK